MDIRKIKKLIELVEESGITELEVSEEEGSVRISRATVAAPANVQYSIPAAAPAPVAAPAAPAAAPAAPLPLPRLLKPQPRQLHLKKLLVIRSALRW